MSIDKAKCVKDKITVREVLDKYTMVHINSRGSCCCPIHKETKPSFYVSKDNKHFNCFGCGASGSVIDFVMKYFNIGFMVAVDKLIKDFNLDDSCYQVDDTERQELLRQKKEKEELEQFVLTQTTRIANRLYELRAESLKYHNQKTIDNETLLRYNSINKRIGELEEMYLILNGIKCSEFKYSQSELVEKLKVGAIKI